MPPQNPSAYLHEYVEETSTDDVGKERNGEIGLSSGSTQLLVSLKQEIGT